MADIKDFVGSVNVENGDVTPITRKKIEQVSPDKWHLMDINALWDQRIVLNNRMVMALQSGHAEIAKQVQQGINFLDALLRRKAAENAKKERDLI